MKKIFISHSSQDKLICDAFVELLEQLGVPEMEILYSSSDRHGVPGDEDIFNYLRKHISDGITVFYMLSDNYYKSIYCLNEMGAAWIVQNDFSIFILPKFTVGIKGVIDGNRKGYSLTSPFDLIRLKEKIIKMYNITGISEMKWEEVKNKFLKIANENKDHLLLPQSNLNKGYNQHTEIKSVNTINYINNKKQSFNIRVGDHVISPKFGEGEVINLYTNYISHISFNNAGTKKLDLRFANLKILD